MTTADVRQLTITRVVDAPRPLVYRAFTHPNDLAQWWGPAGNEMPPDTMDFDVRPGGHQQWTEVNPADPGVLVEVRIDLADVAENEVIDGVMRVAGRLPDGIEPFETRLRVEFYDEPAGRTRIEIRQWVPVPLEAPTRQGWQEALAKLDVALTGAATAWMEA